MRVAQYRVNAACSMDMPGVAAFYCNSGEYYINEIILWRQYKLPPSFRKHYLIANSVGLFLSKDNFKNKKNAM